MTRYSEQDMHPLIQFILNCFLSAVLAGITFGVLNGAFDAGLAGKAYWGLFVFWLLACYGCWFIWFRRKDDSGSDGSGDGWFSSLID